LAQLSKEEQTALEMHKAKRAVYLMETAHGLFFTTGQAYECALSHLPHSG
jgi:hypothetical protein